MRHRLAVSLTVFPRYVKLLSSLLLYLSLSYTVEYLLVFRRLGRQVRHRVFRPLFYTYMRFGLVTSSVRSAPQATGRHWIALLKPCLNLMDLRVVAINLVRSDMPFHSQALIYLQFVFLFPNFSTQFWHLLFVRFV